MDTTIRMMQDKVRDFHKKHSFPIEQNLKDCDSAVAEGILHELKNQLNKAAKAIENVSILMAESGDYRLYRAYLSVEELSEEIEALEMKDEVQLADALGDKMYIDFGTAETYGLYLTPVMDEIHRSNMTKDRRTPDNFRMRLKGDRYSPPNIKEAIQRGRNVHQWDPFNNSQEQIEYCKTCGLPFPSGTIVDGICGGCE